MSEQFGKPLQLVVMSGQDFAFYRPAYRQTYYASRALRVAGPCRTRSRT